MNKHKITKKQKKAAKKIADQQRAERNKLERKPVTSTSILTLTQYLQKQAEKKYAKEVYREGKRHAKLGKDHVH
jgi:hypothetical protein